MGQGGKLREEALEVATGLRRAGMHEEALRLRAAAQHDRLAERMRTAGIATLRTLVEDGQALLASAKGAA